MGEMRPDFADEGSFETNELLKHARETRLRLVAHIELLRAQIGTLEMSVQHTESAACKQREELLSLESAFQRFHEGKIHYDSLGQRAHVEGSVAVLESKLDYAKQVYANGIALLDVAYRALETARQQLAESVALLASGDLNAR